MFDTFQEHCDYEANAQYDYVREANAATALDPYNEGYCDYLADCDREGVEPDSFADWKAGLRAVMTAPRMPMTQAEVDEFPF